jgi:very-short-patch-repair endonuclease
VHSHLERTFLERLQVAALPMPTTQHVILTRDGKVRRVDCWFAEHELVVEVSGHRTHSLRSARRGDAQRHRAIVATGKRVVEFTSDEVFDEWADVERELRALLLCVD